MRTLLLAFAFALSACNGALPRTSVAAVQLDQAGSGSLTEATLTLVNGLGPTTTFLQQATCGVPFPFNMGAGAQIGIGSQDGPQITTVQTVKMCSGARINEGRVPHGDWTRILAGPEKQQYDCAVYVTRRGNGYHFKLGWPQGALTACSVNQDSPTHATFTWNIVQGASLPPSLNVAVKNDADQSVRITTEEHRCGLDPNLDYPYPRRAGPFSPLNPSPTTIAPGNTTQLSGWWDCMKNNAVYVSAYGGDGAHTCTLKATYASNGFDFKVSYQGRLARCKASGSGSSGSLAYRVKV